jgi:hypothetical protein
MNWKKPSYIMAYSSQVAFNSLGVEPIDTHLEQGWFLLAQQILSVQVRQFIEGTSQHLIAECVYCSCSINAPKY